MKTLILISCTYHFPAILTKMSNEPCNSVWISRSATTYTKVCY